MKLKTLFCGVVLIGTETWLKHEEDVETQKTCYDIAKSKRYLSYNLNEMVSVEAVEKRKRRTQTEEADYHPRVHIPYGDSSTSFPKPGYAGVFGGTRSAEGGGADTSKAFSRPARLSSTGVVGDLGSTGDAGGVFSEGDSSPRILARLRRRRRRDSSCITSNFLASFTKGQSRTVDNGEEILRMLDAYSSNAKCGYDVV